MLPKGARTFPLSAGTKIPTPGSRGHLDAKEWGKEGHPVGNYGIALDNQWVLVDFDRPSQWEQDRLPVSWAQSTRRGVHMLYRLPEGVDLSRARNRKFPDGDIKIRGYLVGPGSVVGEHTYKMLAEKEPVEAPQWLIEYVCEKVPEPTPDTAIEKIPEGERDDTFTSIGGLLHRLQLSEEAVCAALQVLEPVLLEAPLGDNALRRIAKSVSKYEDEAQVGALLPKSWLNMADQEYAKDPIKWIVRGFVPRGELVMVYGPGGIGKSSWASWLVAESTSRGIKCAAITVEEPIHRFAWRAQLSGADLHLLLGIPNGSSIQLPRDAEALKECLRVTGVGLLYIDSIYTHFSGVEGENAAQVARKCLGPLAEMAQELGCTIVCTFHENKAGEYLGSTEMINVARYVLKASRTAPGPMYVGIKKTNMWNPGKRMTFEGHTVIAVDPNSGQVQMEEDDEGKLVAQTFVVAHRGEDVGAEDTTINIDSLAASNSEAQERPNIEAGFGDSPNIEALATAKQKRLE
jgi:hypothetical protein